MIAQMVAVEVGEIFNTSARKIGVLDEASRLDHSFEGRYFRLVVLLTGQAPITNEKGYRKSHESRVAGCDTSKPNGVVGPFSPSYSRNPGSDDRTSLYKSFS